jgi:hypothetical protein
MSDAAKKPSAASNAGDKPKYFVHDYSKIGLVEAYRLAFIAAKRHHLAALAAIVHIVKKALRRPMRDGLLFQSVGPKFIQLGNIPPEVASVQEPFVNSLAAAGFTPILAVKSTNQHGSGYGLIMRSNDGLSVANVTFVQVASRITQRRERTVTRAGLRVTSRRTNGGTIVTTNAAPGIRLPSDVKILYLKRASPEEVIARHRRQIADLADIEFIGRDDVPTRVLQRHRSLFEFQVSRGFYVLATEEEIRRHGLSTTPAKIDAPNRNDKDSTRTI